MCWCCDIDKIDQLDCVEVIQVISCYLQWLRCIRYIILVSSLVNIGAGQLSMPPHSVAVLDFICMKTERYPDCDGWAATILDPLFSERVSLRCKVDTVPKAEVKLPFGMSMPAGMDVPAKASDVRAKVKAPLIQGKVYGKYERIDYVYHCIVFCKCLWSVIYSRFFCVLEGACEGVCVARTLV